MSFGRPKKVFTEAELYEYAVGALGRRMRTVAELKRLLRNKVEADTEIGKTLVELVTVRLKDQGYLNDAKYAAAYSSFRRDNEKFGRQRVITDLKIKGVHGDVIEKRGRLDDEDVDRFTAAGFGKDLALEVIAIVAASTITNYTGSVTRTPLEAPFQAHAWSA